LVGELLFWLVLCFCASYFSHFHLLLALCQLHLHLHHLLTSHQHGIYISPTLQSHCICMLVAHPHYNHITFTWHLVLHHLCIIVVFALQILLLSYCLFYIVFFFGVLISFWNYLAISLPFLFDLCKFLCSSGVSFACFKVS
jgi:hypothetical protein